MKFSVITPTYNRAYILGTAIWSVINQTYSNWDMIIIDDGSSDNTKELVESFKDNRIKYLCQTNKGPSAARNYGFMAVTGDWIAYVDSDNELLPNYFEVIEQALKDNPDSLYALSKGNRTLELYENNKLVEKIDDSADFPDELTPKDIAHRTMHFDINGFAHHKKIIDDGIRFDETMDSLEDWDFALTICEKYPGKFLYVPATLFNYHQRFGTDGLVSNAGYEKWVQSFEQIYQKHKNDKLMQGQTWYPDRVNKYKRLAEEEKNGNALPSYLRYFRKG